MMKRMTVLLTAILTISLTAAAVSPKSDGYYGKTKVACKGRVKAYPFDLGQVKLLPCQFAKAIRVDHNYMRSACPVA